jgi:hypothetical protein
MFDIARGYPQGSTSHAFFMGALDLASLMCAGRLSSRRIPKHETFRIDVMKVNGKDKYTGCDRKEGNAGTM